MRAVLSTGAVGVEALCFWNDADDSAGLRIQGEQHTCRQQPDAHPGGCGALVPRTDEADADGQRGSGSHRCPADHPRTSGSCAGRGRAGAKTGRTGLLYPGDPSCLDALDDTTETVALCRVAALAAHAPWGG